MENGLLKVNGKIVGQVVDNLYIEKTYITERDKETWVKKYNGFGITVDVLGELLSREVKRIEVYYQRDDGRVEIYRSTPKQWADKGTKDELGGYEEQYFLSSDDFIEVRTRR